MYVQNEPSYGRSWFPGQDTPSVKTPYKASVTVPFPLKSRMSANLTSDFVTPDGKHQITSFINEIPVPTYLMTIVVGNIVQKKIGKRSGVYSEPEVIEECFNELD